MATNYEKLFGSPEAAALTLHDICACSGNDTCDECVFWGSICPNHSPSMCAEWLQEECDD